MKFRVYRTYEGRQNNPKIPNSIEENEKWFLELNTIEELLNLTSESRWNEIIIGKDDIKPSEWFLEVYDWYRE